MSILEQIIDIPATHESNVFGQFDAYAKKIERSLHITLIPRDGHVKILGEAKRVDQAKRVLEQLVALSKRGNTITEQNVDYAISLVFEDSEKDIACIFRSRQTRLTQREPCLHEVDQCTCHQNPDHGCHIVVHFISSFVAYQQPKLL